MKTKTLTIPLLLLFLISSCNMAKHYANQRAGGHFNKDSENSLSINECAEQAEHNMTILENPDTSHLIALREEKSPAIKKIPDTTQTSPDTTTVVETPFVMDEELYQAYASPFFNSLAATFGLLTFVYTDFIWMAAPLYIASAFCAFIGLICFFIALVRYNSGESDPRNKKYLWLWVLAFILSILFALIPILMFF